MARTYASRADRVASLLAKQGRPEGGGISVHLGEVAGVDVERDADVRVAELLAHPLWVEAGRGSGCARRTAGGRRRETPRAFECASSPDLKEVNRSLCLPAIHLSSLLTRGAASGNKPDLDAQFPSAQNLRRPRPDSRACRRA